MGDRRLSSPLRDVSKYAIVARRVRRQNKGIGSLNGKFKHFSRYRRLAAAARVLAIRPAALYIQQLAFAS
ncbi:MAG: hypothetical protein ACI9HK_004671 [Pirellulaceae bacterium]|jgi:hypothetical protein